MAVTTKHANNFDRLNAWLNNIEGSAVNLASTIVPWLTPIAPMVMTFNHASVILGHWVWAIPVAATVELLGFATISTIVHFWMFNKKNKAEYKKAPTWIAVIMFGFYLALVLSTNVLLDLGPKVGLDADYVEIVVKALFTMQTIPGAVIVVVRAGHRNLLKEIEKTKQDAAQADTQGAQVAGKKKGKKGKKTQVARKSVKEADLIAYLQANKNETQEQVALHFGVTRSAIGQRIAKLVKDGKLKI